jgi:hypothetical protein
MFPVKGDGPKELFAVENHSLQRDFGCKQGFPIEIQGGYFVIVPAHGISAVRCHFLGFRFC